MVSDAHGLTSPLTIQGIVLLLYSGATNSLNLLFLYFGFFRFCFAEKVTFHYLLESRFLGATFFYHFIYADFVIPYIVNIVSIVIILSRKRKALLLESMILKPQKVGPRGLLLTHLNGCQVILLDYSSDVKALVCITISIKFNKVNILYPPRYRRRFFVQILSKKRNKRLHLIILIYIYKEGEGPTPRHRVGMLSFFFLLPRCVSGCPSRWWRSCGTWCCRPTGCSRRCACSRASCARCFSRSSGWCSTALTQKKAATDRSPM